MHCDCRLCFKDNKRIPFFPDAADSLLPETAVGILLDARRKYQSVICSDHPVRCCVNSTFLIDTTKLDNPKDFKADDHGVFKNNRVQHTYFTSKLRGDQRRIERLPSRPRLVKKEMYDLKTTYWMHKKDQDFKRRSHELVDLSSGRNMAHILLQYSFDGEEHAVDLVPHCFSKGRKPYRRSKDSLREKVAIKLQEGKKAGKVYDEIVEEQGGIASSQSLGSIPKSMQEIHNAKRRLSGRMDKNEDEMFRLVEICKNDDMSDQPFLRRVVLAPEPMCVFASNRQMQDMKRFLTDPGNPIIMGVDSTFNLGPFLATVITYRHPLLDHRQSRKSPVMLGPILMHVKRSVESYSYLGQVLTNLLPELANIQWIGSDRESAIFKGLHRSFIKSKNIICTKHVRDNVIHKLTEMGVGRKEKLVICNDIFGDGKGATRLINAENEESFDVELLDLKRKWLDEDKILNGKRFVEYFCRCIAQDMKSSMITPVRKSAGVSDGCYYYNNDNESLNAKMKRKVERKRNDWSTFVQLMKEMEQEQSRNVERSLFDEGPYCLKPELIAFGASSDEFHTMTKQEKKCVIEKFRHFEPTFSNGHHSPEFQSSGKTDDDNEIPMVIPPPSSLSVTFQEFNLPSTLFAEMWDKAARLHESEGGIVNAPLSDSCWIVASERNQKPHFVSKGKGDIYKCDCFGFREKSFCSHALVVAEKCGRLREMLLSFCRKKQPSLSQLAYRGMPSYPGEKPGTKHRKRSRRGNSSVASQALPKVPSVLVAEDDRYTVRQLAGTRIRICYGCGNLFRIPPEVPLPPDDVVFARKEFRAFKNKEGLMKITANKEYVHYHLRKSCLLEKNKNFTSSMILLKPEIHQILNRMHYHRLTEEFGLSFD